MYISANFWNCQTETFSNLNGVRLYLIVILVFISLVNSVNKSTEKKKKCFKLKKLYCSQQLASQGDAAFSTKQRCTPPKQRERLFFIEPQVSACLLCK